MTLAEQSTFRRFAVGAPVLFIFDNKHFSNLDPGLSSMAEVEGVTEEELASVGKVDPDETFSAVEIW